MSKSDYLDIAALDHQVSTGGKLSESDVDRVLSIANGGPGMSPYVLQSRQIIGSGVFKYADYSQLPQSRLNQIYDFASILAESSSPKPIIVWSGCMILGRLHDKRAISILRPLSKSSNPDISHFASEAIQRLKTT